MEYELARFLLKVFGLKVGLRLYNLFASDTRRQIIGNVYTNGVHVPAFYDISHWKEVSDWAHITPHPIIMGTKATQGISYKDPTFVDYFAKFRDVVNCRRLAYHFFEKTMNPTQQADWFCNFIEPHISSDDILCLDFEQGGETASMLWAFLDRVHQRFPNNQRMNYSRKNLMDPIAMNESEKAYFKTIPTWPAGYPNDYSGYTTTPPSYIPDQTKWGKVWAWQYTDQAPVSGIVNGCDANLVEQVMLDWLGEPAPDVDEVTYPFTGVKRIVGRRFDSDIYATILDPTLVRFEVRHEQPFDNGLLLVSQVCRSVAAQLGWNGDEWTKQNPLPAYPKNLAVSNGSVYVARTSAEPSLNIRTNQVAEITHQTTGNEYNTSTGRRYLIENGVIKSYLYGSEAQYTERHPRGLTGITQQGKVIMVTVDGRSNVSRGITLLEGAEILLALGAYKAFDRGGGGDAVDVMDGIVQNVPCDTGTNGQPGVERAVPQAIVVYAQKENTMAYRYRATANGDNTRIRPDHNTNNTAYNSGTSTYVRGTTFDGDELFTATADLSSGGTVIQKAGDKWLRVLKINGQNPTHPNGQPITTPVWVAVLHLGNQQICTLVDNDGTEPPPTDPENIQVHIEITMDGYNPITVDEVMTPVTPTSEV